MMRLAPRRPSTFTAGAGAGQIGQGEAGADDEAGAGQRASGLTIDPAFIGAPRARARVRADCRNNSLKSRRY